MSPEELLRLLNEVREGHLSPEGALDRLRTLPYEDLGFAKIDHHRALRRGVPEVIFGAGKTPEQIVAIAGRMAGRGQGVLVTRASQEAFAALRREHPGARYEAAARCVLLDGAERPSLGGRLAVVCAGTSDLPVAEEA